MAADARQLLHLASRCEDAAAAVAADGDAAAGSRLDAAVADAMDAAAKCGSWQDQIQELVEQGCDGPTLMSLLAASDRVSSALQQWKAVSAGLPRRLPGLQSRPSSAEVRALKVDASSTAAGQGRDSTYPSSPPGKGHAVVAGAGGPEPVLPPPRAGNPFVDAEVAETSLMSDSPRKPASHAGDSTSSESLRAHAVADVAELAALRQQVAQLQQALAAARTQQQQQATTSAVVQQQQAAERDALAAANVQLVCRVDELHAELAAQSSAREAAESSARCPPRWALRLAAPASQY